MPFFQANEAVWLLWTEIIVMYIVAFRTAFA
jgi:hypothetical protein